MSTFKQPLKWKIIHPTIYARYRTIPNRHFLYLPVQELAHAAGALVVLWVTNRENYEWLLEKELFPSLGVGVKDATVFYWLKVYIWISPGSCYLSISIFIHLSLLWSLLLNLVLMSSATCRWILMVLWLTTLTCSITGLMSTSLAT
jgi:hypothetical protein